MRCVIKRGEEAGDHRSSTPRLGSQPSLSVLSRRRRNPSVVGLPSYGFVRSPSAFVAAVPSLRSKLRSVTLATRSRRRPRPSLSGLLWLAIPTSPVRATARRPHQDCGAVCHGSYSFSTAHPHVSEYEKREASPPPFGDVKPTLPIRVRRFRAWTNPTLSRPPSPGDRRSERSGCVRPHLARPRHRDV